MGCHVSGQNKREAKDAKGFGLGMRLVDLKRKSSEFTLLPQHVERD